MRALATLYLGLSIGIFGCSRGPQATTPSSPPPLANDLPSQEEQHQPWGAVKPRLSKVMTLGESYHPSPDLPEDHHASHRAPAVSLQVNNNVTNTTTLWPTYGWSTYGWSSSGQSWGRSGHSSSACRPIGGDSRGGRDRGNSRSSLPPVGGDW